MKISRPPLAHALRSFFVFAAPVVLAASAVTLALQPVDASAVIRSHTHHSSARPLPVSSFVQPSSKHRKSNLEHSFAVGPHGSKASHHQSGSSRSSRGARTRQQQQPADLPAMHRASRGKGRHNGYTASNEPAHFGRHGRHGTDTVVAEVSSRSGDAYLAHLHARNSAPAPVTPASSPARP